MLTKLSTGAIGLILVAASVAVSLGVSACTGAIGGMPSSEPSTTGAGGTAGASASGTAGHPAGTGTAGSAAMAGPASLLNLPGSPLPTTSLHKLTAFEFANSMQDLLGSGVPLAPVEADTLIGGFATVGASSVSLSPAGVGQYDTIFSNATAYAFADATRAASLLACMPTGPTDSACLTQALNAFGRRAFRRPLGADETTLFLNIATTIAGQAGSSALTGIRYAVMAILESPDFLYRVEVGAPSAADGGRMKYTSFEMASRLAATLWASVPDDVLLDAAAKDALSTPAGTMAQAQRMLADPRAHRSVAAFVDQLYDAFDLGQAAKDTTMFPAYTPTLQAAMMTELELRVDDMVFTQKGDYLSLLESTSTFANKELATFYGVPLTATDNGFHKIDLPAGTPRVGILGSAGLLAGHGHEQLTSPTHRGKFVREMLLCETIPPPPPGVPPLPQTAPPGSTVRQVMTTHRSAAQCSACHALMDPIGFGMENFDTTGQYRTMDNGQTIDASGQLDNVQFNGLAQLGKAVRENAVTGPCAVSKVYENALGRLPVDVDQAALNSLIGQFTKSGNKIDQLLVNLVANDGFRFVAPM
jgi:hypothetical protein